MTTGHIVVTGGRGYLGKHLVAELVARDCFVTVIDVSPAPEPESGAMRHLRCDVRDRAAMYASFAGADAVIHAAFAPPQARRSELRSVNVSGAEVVCDAALTAGARRVVVLSSTIVDRALSPHPILVNSPVSRLHEYAESRRAAEVVAGNYGRRGLDVAIVRPKTFVGPGRVGGFALIFELVRRGDVVPLLGSGQARYQLVDVRDLARGVASLAMSKTGGIIGFGAARFESLRADLSSLIDHAGTSARIRPMPGFLGRGALRAIELAGLAPLAEWHHCIAGDRDSVIDIGRARAELGWEPQFSNAEALASAYDWYVATAANNRSGITTHPVPTTHRALRKAANVFLH